MPEVIVHDDESFDRALKRFKKIEKPSEKRKRKLSAAVRNSRRGPRVPRV